jgi:hypothetical protein
VFDGFEDAVAFFETTLFDFGLASALQGDAPAVRAIFDVQLGAGDALGLGMGFVSSVPEPATGPLVSLGLLGLAARRRRARR